MMDLNLLIVFEALMEARSVSKASAALGVSQPSLSHSLAKLRTTFGDPMFIRVKNVMEPTPRALEIAEPVKSALNLARTEIFRSRGFVPATATRTFTVCMSDIGQAAYLPAIVREVRKVAPLIKLQAVSLSSDKLETELESGGVDLAVGYFPDLKNAGYFQQYLLKTSGFVCIANLKSRFIKSGAIDPEAFLKAPHVSVRTEGRSQELVESVMNSLHIARNVVLTVPHYLGLLRIIPGDDLIAIVPKDLAETFGRQSGIGIFSLPFPSPSVEIIQIWHQRFHKDDANRWLRSLVKGALY